MTEVVSGGNLLEALGGTVKQGVLVGKVEQVVEMQKIMVLGGREQLVRVAAVNIGLPALLHLDQRFFKPDGLPAVGDVVVVDAVLRPSGMDRGMIVAQPLTVARLGGLVEEQILGRDGKVVDTRVTVTRERLLWEDVASLQFDAIEYGSVALVVRSHNLE